MTSDLAQRFTEQEPFGFVQLPAEVVGPHAVRLVDDDKVPFGFPELILQLFVAGKLVHASDQQRIGVEDVEVDVGVDQLVRQ